MVGPTDESLLMWVTFWVKVVDENIPLWDISTVVVAKDVRDCEGDEVINTSDGIVVTGTLLDGWGRNESAAVLFTNGVITVIPWLSVEDSTLNVETEPIKFDEEG